MGKVYGSQLASECDGWVEGEVIKTGSLPINRLDLDGLSTAVRELIEGFFEDGWLGEMVCDQGCVGGASVFEIKPTKFEFGPEGGEQILEIIVGETDKWKITQSE